MALEKLGVVDIEFEMLEFQKIILEVAGSQFNITIEVLKKKLWLNGDEIGDINVGSIWD